MLLWHVQCRSKSGDATIICDQCVVGVTTFYLPPVYIDVHIREKMWNKITKYSTIHVEARAVYLLEASLYRICLVNESLLEVCHAVVAQFERLLTCQCHVLHIVDVQLHQERFQVIHLFLFTLRHQFRRLLLLSTSSSSPLWQTSNNQCCDLETKVSRLESTRVHFSKVSVSVSRSWCQGLGIETVPRSWSRELSGGSHSQQDAADFT